MSPGRPSNIGGTTHIPIESIRLKQIRDGLEDYEYLRSLDQQIGRTAAMSLIGPVITNTYTYTGSPSALLGLRTTIGSMLSAAGPGQVSVDDFSVTEGSTGTMEATVSVTLAPPAAAAPAKDASATTP